MTFKVEGIHLLPCWVYTNRSLANFFPCKQLYTRVSCFKMNCAEMQPSKAPTP